MEIINKKEAEKLNLKYFFTGKLCKRGHLSKRKIKCGTCYECHLLLNKPYNYNDTVKNRKLNWNDEQKLKYNKDKLKYANSDKGKNNQKKYLKTEKGKEVRKKSLDNYKEKGIRKHLYKYYKITLEQYNEMLINQNGKCKICNITPNKKLCVDHCHTTGKIRGLLCSRCNIGIGMLKDNIEYLLSAINYLKKGE